MLCILFSFIQTFVPEAAAFAAELGPSLPAVLWAFSPSLCTGYPGARLSERRRTSSALEALCFPRSVVDSAGETPGFIRSATQNAHAMSGEVHRVPASDGRHRDVINAPTKAQSPINCVPRNGRLCGQVVAREQISVELLHGDAPANGRRIWRQKYAVVGDQGNQGCRVFDLYGRGPVVQ